MELPAQPLTIDELVTRMRHELAGADAAPTNPFMGCDGILALAQQNAEIGAGPPLRAFQGALRPVARAAAQTVLYLARFITDAQVRFNHHVLSALSILDEGARRLDARSIQQAERTTARLLELERALWRLRADVGRVARSPASGLAVRAPDPATDRADLDALYLALEDRFRGPRALIKERLGAYLPVIDVAGVRPDDHCLDIGCGRGEWLELLRDRGGHVQGVDSNRAMIDGCRALDLDVIHGDAVAFLRGIGDGSAALVTAFHIVEHLTFPTLVTLLDEAVRVLRRDGLLIIETPNPDYPQVATRDFHLDPTHRRPLPPALLTFLAEAKGFDRIHVVSAQPNQPALDYALIARRP